MIQWLSFSVIVALVLGTTTLIIEKLFPKSSDTTDIEHKNTN